MFLVRFSFNEFGDVKTEGDKPLQIRIVRRQVLYIWDVGEYLEAFSCPTMLVHSRPSLCLTLTSETEFITALHGPQTAAKTRLASMAARCT